MALNKKAVALLSGGLDSCLAIKLMRLQGIEVEALHFKTVFECCKEDAAAAARSLGVKLTMVTMGEDLLDLIRTPKYGWGRSVNPCIDCRIYMFKIAKKFMQLVNASFVISGEVLGQRPKSQMKDALQIIPRQSGLEDLLLRPLSAKLLKPTLPEREGIVDREKLYDIEGRSRHRLIELGRQVGLETLPNASNGCILTDENYGRRVKDHLAHFPDQTIWDFELMKVGRHYRLDETHKVVFGRKEHENERLASLHERSDGRKTTYLEPVNFSGPSALLVGDFQEPLLSTIGSMMLSFSKKGDLERPQILFRGKDASGNFAAGKGLEELVKI